MTEKCFFFALLLRSLCCLLLQRTHTALHPSANTAFLAGKLNGAEKW